MPKLGPLAALVALVAPGHAFAALRVKWDCFLPSSSVDCALLRASLTSKIPFINVVPTPDEADVVVTVGSVPAESGTRFLFDFVGKKVDGYASEVHSTDKIPSTIDTPTATVRVLTKIERGLDDFMEQKIVAEVKGGTLEMSLSDPTDLPFQGRPEQSALRWYVSPSIGAYLSDVTGVGINASGSAAISYNYSADLWRLQQQVSANYAEQSEPVVGTNETASIEFFGGNAVNVFTRAISDDNRWTLGLLAAAEKNPQGNYRYRGNASIGVEFDLVPKQTVDQRNIGFRCALGPEAQRYDALNIVGKSQAVVGRQFCDAFVSWHFQPIDVSATLSETTLQDVSYRAVSASGSITWRITDNLLVSPWINLQQINKALDEAAPVTTVYANPQQELEASLLATVQSGYTAPFGVQSGLTLRYVFGNGSLATEDQRWKGTSNLR